MSEIRYAKIINEETHEVQVGVGCPDEYYVEIGMTEMDVELAYDGNWYVAGYAPEEPAPSESEIIAQQVAELKAKLSDTDYVVIKIAEATGEDADAMREKYAQVIADRKEWRKQINELENKE